MVAQGQELLRTFRRLVEGKISRRGTFRFIVAAMRHRIDALLPVPRRRKDRWEIGAPHCRKAGADTWVRAGTHVELRSFQRTYVGTMRL